MPLAEALARVTSGPAAVLRAVARKQAPCGAAPAGMLAPARPPTFVWSTWTWNRRRIPQRCLACGSALSPFAGMMLPGRVRATVVGGSLAWETPA